ncbi:hypothetical protein F4780DRAFT_775099 [Xylariomycetidae sp. FL0641]|nr:hypothetical protein F4780DRAFT_775099 [Xylariomycetidae sp. FL0641]
MHKPRTFPDADSAAEAEAQWTQMEKGSPKQQQQQQHQPPSPLLSSESPRPRRAAAAAISGRLARAAVGALLLLLALVGFLRVHRQWVLEQRSASWNYHWG